MLDVFLVVFVSSALYALYRDYKKYGWGDE
jgi:hypothetical protein